MSAWDDFTKAVTDAARAVPLVGSVPLTLGDLAQGHYKKAGEASLANIPGVGIAQDVSQMTGGNASAATSGGGPSADQQAASLIKGLNYGQEEDPNAQLITQLSGLMKGLSPSQASALLKQLPSTTLSSSLSEALSGEPVSQIVASNQAATNPQSQSAYGFDPLSLGQMFSTVLAPWLAQQQKTATTGENSTAAAMKQALSGASPQLQQAYAAAIPSMQGAENTVNQAATQAVATGPEWDSLVTNLTDAVNQAKLAQAAAQAEPYWSATTTGAAPNAAGGSPVANAQNTVASLQQQVLQNALAQSH